MLCLRAGEDEGIKVIYLCLFHQMMYSLVEPYNGHITLTVENIISVLSLGFIMVKKKKKSIFS